MSIWKRRKRVSGRGSSAADTGRAQKTKKSVKRSPPVPMEVKILAIEALESGLSAGEVGELVGVGSGTIHKWRKDYEESGVQGLCRKASSIATRKQCSVLEEKIVARRRENPEHGVRRIRDDLRRHEGIEVSAETVRTVVNDAGLGNGGLVVSVFGRFGSVVTHGSVLDAGTGWVDQVYGRSRMKDAGSFRDQRLRFPFPSGMTGPGFLLVG